jgi:hypothetical protein
VECVIGVSLKSKRICFAYLANYAVKTALNPKVVLKCNRFLEALKKARQIFVKFPIKFFVVIFSAVSVMFFCRQTDKRRDFNSRATMLRTLLKRQWENKIMKMGL